MNFDIKAAVHFVAVAEEASFTRAAAKLGLAQPWLSQRIRLLEAQLGFALFTRTTRRIELTEKGHAFLAAARPLAQAAAALAQAARALGHADPARLRIGAPPYSARIPVRTKLVSDFMARHGDVSLELEIGWTPLLLERVLSGALDGAFGIGWLQPEGLRQVPICTLAVEFLLAADDPLAGTGPLPAAALAGRRVAVFTRGLYPQLFDVAFKPLAQAGAQLVQIVEFHEEPEADQRETPPLIVTDFGLGRSSLAKSVKRTRRPLQDSPPVPFSFFTRAEGATAPAERFWRLAQQYAQT
ncbi:LysR family transcriptional regulator [Oleomonas cavernae]|uniref:LysR family transcriptional regulator n=1 Tax=Oleomonas cavernae TaxID=2320859 RepID=UPI0023680382|nr:LysR family transcriptional regulator [Oleomonas cavernae]